MSSYLCYLGIVLLVASLLAAASFPSRALGTQGLGGKVLVCVTAGVFAGGMIAVIWGILLAVFGRRR